MSVSLNPYALKPYPGPARSVYFIQSGTGAVSRTVQGKESDIRSTSDFGGTDAEKFAYLNAQMTGGLALVPAGTYSLGTFEFTADGKYINDSTTLLSTPLFNVGETPGGTTTRHLTVTSLDGTNLNKKRFGEFSRMEAGGAGSTVALTGTGDFTFGLNAHKENYNASASDGEIGTLYLTLRQGGSGASKNDASGILADILTYSDSFVCFTEGAVKKVNGAGTTTDAVRVITGFINKATSDMGGHAVVLETGTASNLFYVEIDNGAFADKLLKFVDLTTGVYNASIFAIESDGEQVTYMRNALTSTLNDTIITRSMNAGVGSRDEMRERVVRTVGGVMDFTSSEWRHERVIDGSTVTGGMYLGYHATYGHMASFGSAGTKLLSVGSNLYMGFNGATPIQRPTLNAASTDLATVIALTNQIRLGLITYGLFQ